MIAPLVENGAESGKPGVQTKQLFVNKQKQRNIKYSYNIEVYIATHAIVIFSYL